MAATEDRTTAGTADHLCVFVHGLWGNPGHLKYMADSMRARFDESKIHIHVAVQNSGNFTYDGIERGGERVLMEIEDLLKEFAAKGIEIKKFSLVGYSLGGLVSRYLVGLMYAKGLFDKMTPINFTTFATPHLGVRTPLLGVHNRIWNVLGARTLSASGRQLFTIDDFRNTGRPLLHVMADKKLSFWKGLSVFKNRYLYANIVNDRSVPFYTSHISRFDPYEKLNKVSLDYLQGYGNIILDPSKPPMPLPDKKKIRKSKASVISGIPYFLLFSLILPVGVCVFLTNTFIQSIASSKRIKIHDKKHGHNHSEILKGLEDTVHQTFDTIIEDLNHTEENQHLPDESEASTPANRSGGTSTPNTLVGNSAHPSYIKFPSLDETTGTLLKLKSHSSEDHFPTLALTPYQFEMIENLNELGFSKTSVHIHKVRHSHAAIIYRRSGTNFDEGATVAKHWLDALERDS